MKSDDVKSKIYINYNKEKKYKDPLFRVGDFVGISKCKNNFTKTYIPNWFEEVSINKKVKKNCFVVIFNKTS